MNTKRTKTERTATLRMKSASYVTSSSDSVDHISQTEKNAPFREQLKLSVYTNNGLITVRVIQARHLNSRWGTTCDAYVKVHLIPEEPSKQSQFKTSVVMDTNHPMFEEQFSVEVSEADYDRRLYLSVWNRDSTKRCSEFLGCMSFGIRRLMTTLKKVSGWYYLMSEEKGRRKHLLAAKSKHGVLKERGPVINRSNLSRKTNPLKNESVKHAFTLVMPKRKQGYGFTVCSRSPVYVGKVEQGSVAESAGLLPNDHITVINGQTVSFANCEMVAEIIRTSYRQIVLDVERGCEPGRCQWHINYLQSTEQTHDSHCRQDKENLHHCRQTQSRECHITAPSTVAFKELSSMEQQQQLAVQSLLECEREFAQIMKTGIQQYSRPLRHRFLNSQEHRAVFQNKEKLVTLSEYHLKHLQEAGLPYSDVESHAFIDKVGAVYRSKGDFHKEAYMEYCQGLRKAECVLTLLVRSKQDLDKFLSARQNDFDIDLFIHKPIEHLSEMVQILQVILQNTLSTSQDFPSLQQTVQGLGSILNEFLLKTHTSLHQTSQNVQSSDFLRLHNKHFKNTGPASHQDTEDGQFRISGLNQQTSHSSSVTDSVSSHHSLGSQHSLSQNSAHSERSNVSRKSTSSSADSEMLSLQSKLLFSENVKMFYLATPNRHLIYAADLLMLHGKNWNKMHVFLLTDMVLITQQEADGRLTLIYDPVYISSIVKADFECAHPTEVNFTLQNKDPEDSHKSWESHNLTIRAPNMDQKYVWKGLLEHRINTHKTLMELVPTNCQVDDFMESFGVL